MTHFDQLTPDEQQLLKDTFNYGAWGDCDMEFLNEHGEIETVHAYGYCTNDAKQGGHFTGRQISQMFRSAYKKLCNPKGIGQFLTHISDWWGDGSGDMLFIRFSDTNLIEDWAKNENYDKK